MIEVSEELKTLYRTDYFPARDTQLDKQLKLYFPELDKTITNEKIYSESMKLTESICSESDLTLGGCEAAEFSITVAGVGDEIVGKKMIVTQIVDGRFEMSLGTYRVKSAKKKDDLNFKEILAYDAITDTDIDVSNWYNSLSWPQTVKSMRESLLKYMGIEYEEQNLTNDTVSLEKTISPSQLLGRTVLKKLCEINAGFGRISRNGKFKVVQLTGIGLYPSETLYPAEDLFPAESGEYVTTGYIKADYEDYIVEPITAVTIRENDEDIGATEGTLENPYVITDNFLLYGKSSGELHNIAANILLQVKNKFYRPHSTTMIGLPYMEAGDAVTIITNTDAIETFIFQRELTGIQVLRDTIKATGNQYRDQKTSSNEEMQQLKSKTLKLKKEIDQLSIEMTDMESGLQGQITLTASQLQTQITDNYNELSSSIIQTASSLQTQITDVKNNTNSQITQLANNISLKVSKGDVSSQLSMEHDQITITSNRLKIESDQFKLDGGTAWFGGTISWGEGNTISNDRNGNTFFAASQLLNFNAPAITLGSSNSIIIQKTGRVDIDGNVRINNGIPITDINKSSYTFPPASHTHTFTTLYNNNGIAHVTSYEYNFRPHSSMGDNEISCGSPSYRWTQVFAATPTISTSDGNLKELIGDVTEAEKRVARKIKSLITKFKYKDSIAKKGNDARVHFGVVAQDVKAAFESEGLDPYQYGLFCSDTWYEKDGNACDENGKPYTKEDKGVKEVTRLSLRNEELHYFILKSLD